MGKENSHYVLGLRVAEIALFLFVSFNQGKTITYRTSLFDSYISMLLQISEIFNVLIFDAGF